MTSELIFFYNNYEEFWISLLIQIKSKPYNAMTVFLCYFGGGGRIVLKWFMEICQMILFHQISEN